MALMIGNHMTTNKKVGLPRPAPRIVAIDRVLTDEDAFQPRGGGLNEAHVAGLVEVLKLGQKLDPLGMWEDPETGKLTVADGHHRLEAYPRHGKAKGIPVEVYRCRASWPVDGQVGVGALPRLSTGQGVRPDTLSTLPRRSGMACPPVDFRALRQPLWLYRIEWA